jgi:hypothetical protein
MKNAPNFLLMGLALWSSCTQEQPSGTTDALAGSYAREFTYPVNHPETGRLLGTSTIRDTIVIRSQGSGYEVSQTKWRLNDYDPEGWQNQQHAQDRPLPAYQASFRAADNQIYPVREGNGPLLYVDVAKGTLYRNKDRDKAYQRVK